MYPASVPEITVQELKALMDLGETPFILDVREDPDDADTRHVPVSDRAFRLGIERPWCVESLRSHRPIFLPDPHVDANHAVKSQPLGKKTLRLGVSQRVPLLAV